MKILLIGGAGFIGSRTALRLLQQGHNPVVVDSLDPQIHGEDISQSATCRPLQGKVPIIKGDTRDSALLQTHLVDAEAVYYFPACTGTGQSMYEIERYSDVNVRGAAIFCEALTKQKSVKKVIVSSTRAIYGEGAAYCEEHGRVYPAPRALDDLEAGQFACVCPACGEPVQAVSSLEDDPAKPVSIYGITKFAQEQIIGNICQALNIPCVTFRYQNVYGPGQSLNNAYTGILSIFTQLLMAGRDINLFEDAAPTRDFVFIDDVVEYNVRALDATETVTLNLGSGVRSTLTDLVQALQKSLGTSSRYFISGQFRVGDIRNAVADLELLTSVLGAHKFTSLQDGVDQFVAWVRTGTLNPEANARFDRSLEEMRAAGLLRGAAQS